MSGLQFIEAPPAQTTWRFLIYGSPGSGKTTAALSAPGPILLINADRPTASRAARARYPKTKIREVQFAGKSTLIDVCMHVKNAADDTKTVVVDTLSEVYRMLLDDFSNGASRPTQQNYLDAQVVIDRFVRFIRDLDVNVILVCHEEMVTDRDELIVRPLTGGKKTPEVIGAQVDVTAYCAPIETDRGISYRAQFVTSHGRQAKDGTGMLGQVRNANVGEWIAVINGEAK